MALAHADVRELDSADEMSEGVTAGGRLTVACGGRAISVCLMQGLSLAAVRARR